MGPSPKKVRGEKGLIVKLRLSRPFPLSLSLDPYPFTVVQLRPRTLLSCLPGTRPTRPHPDPSVWVESLRVPRRPSWTRVVPLVSRTTPVYPLRSGKKDEGGGTSRTERRGKWNVGRRRRRREDECVKFFPTTIRTHVVSTAVPVPESTKKTTVTLLPSSRKSVQTLFVNCLLTQSLLVSNRLNLGNGWETPSGVSRIITTNVDPFDSESL